MKTIEARAIISAKDATGQVFDKLAKKIAGVERTAKAFSNIKAPTFTGNMMEELKRLGLAEKELQSVRRSFSAFDQQLRAQRPQFQNYVRAHREFADQTVQHWRRVRESAEDAGKAHEKAQRRFFVSPGRFGLHALGFAGGAYLAHEAARATARQVGERGRELARYDLGGLDADEKAAAEAKAGEISSRYPNLSRTEILGHIRQLRARLGSFEHAMDNVETVAKAQTVLSTLGSGEGAGEDLEKLVLGLESQGLGSNPDKFRSYLDAFVKAKSLFPDLRGEDFRQYMQRANSSKYALSSDYLEAVAPTMMQHEGASNFGTMQASAFSALIGKRQTKAAKARMNKFGLLGKNGDIVDAQKFIENPYSWAVDRLAPALEKGGITMDEAHRGKMVDAITQMFSNRKVGEFFASLLVNQGIIEKDRLALQSAKGTEGAATSRTEDPFVAFAGLTTQMKDFGTALIGTKQAIEMMNSAADEFAKRTEAIRKGDWLSLLPEDDQRIIRAARNAGNTAADQEGNRRDQLQRQLAEADQKLSPAYGLGEQDKARWRMRRFEIERKIWQSKNAGSMPPIFSDEERDRWEEIDREHRRGNALSGLTPNWSRGPRIPLPTSDPRRFGEMPPVQPLDEAPQHVDVQVQADVQNNEITLKLEASKWWDGLEKKVDNLIKVVGSIGTNGPGSRGTSSPDAAPGRGFTGVGGQPY